jgi:hypothetical protein
VSSRVNYSGFNTDIYVIAKINIFKQLSTSSKAYKGDHRFIIANHSAKDQELMKAVIHRSLSVVLYVLGIHRES